MNFLTERTRAEFALLCAALIWGATFPFIRISLAEISAYSLMFLRTLCSVLVFAPMVLMHAADRKKLFKLLPLGLILGGINFFGYLFQSFGLETLNSGRSAFLTNLSIVIVPFLSPLFKRGLPQKNDFISVCLALVGMTIMTQPFSGAGFGIGDLWTILSAICFSIHIQSIQLIVEKYQSSKVIAFLQLFHILILSSSLLPKSSTPLFPHSLSAWFAILYLGVISMVLTTFIQTRFQFKTTPERAVLIYMLEPLFAIIFGYMILHERLSFNDLFGGFLMLLAVVWVYLLKTKNWIFSFKIKELVTSAKVKNEQNINK